MSHGVAGRHCSSVNKSKSSDLVVVCDVLGLAVNSGLSAVGLEANGDPTSHSSSSFGARVSSTQVMGWGYLMAEGWA